MRNLYLLFMAIFMNGQLWSQTAPTPQTLPYTQDFSGVLHSSTAYPVGMNGWRLSNAITSNFNTGAGTADAALTANGSASSTTGALYNFNGKFGFLSSGSGDFGLVVAINTTGTTGITVAYDAATIRNPYNGSTNTRINEMVLQYRVGTSGSFTTIAASVYQNNTTAQTTTGLTTPQNSINKSITLPAACDNQAVVHLRWVNRDASGGGARPSFAIDNISVTGTGGGDITAPTVTTLQPANGAVGLSPATSISVQFSENIVANTGNIILYNTTNNTQQVFAVGTAAVSIAGNTLTLNTALKASKNYAIAIEAGALKDQAGNLFAGLSANAWTFSTAAQPTSFDFNDCVTSLSGGFKQYSVTGAQVWACTSFGQTGNGVQINGFSGSAQNNEDWLISPAFDLSGFNYPILNFSSRVRFSGPSLQLKISTNYSGTGDPNLASWTTINGRFADPDSDVWTLSDNIDLSAFKAENVYVAFVYTSSPALSAARWTLDDFNIANNANPPAAGVDIRGSNIDFDYVASGEVSAAKTLTVEGYNLTSDITLTAPVGFEISLDQTNYVTSLTITQAQAAAKNTIYARFRPAAADQTYSGNLQVSGNGFNKQSFLYTGTSLRSLKVVNWNLEWFGSTASGLGPTNKDQQQQNVQQVLTALNADIYALVEIVDTLRFKNVADALPGNYGYVVNDYGSYADNVNDPDYAGAQKLGFIYKKDVVNKITTRGLLRTSSGNAFNSWASGRYPYLMQAEVNLNGGTSLVDFIVVHAKANTGNTADKIEGYDRRKAGADELKDTLDAAFANSRFIILGDFNDDLDKTITTEVAPKTASSYSTILADPTNYKPLTLPLSLAGNRSTVSFPDMIDHVVTSSELAISYVPNSARVFTDVQNLITSYGSSTSDHYPIVTRYDWRYFRKPEISLSDIGLFNDPGKCNITTTLATPTVTGFNAIATINSNAPASFPVGVTTVTWTATDIYGNTSTKTQLVTVTDQEKPNITAPASINMSNTASMCGATITDLGNAMASDNCGITTVTNDAPTTFPIGTTTVTWTATDIHGNTNTATQLVTVVDAEKPTIIAPAAVNVSNTKGLCGATIEDIGNATASDNCGIATVTNDAPATFPIGSTTVTWTATDIHGNTNIATQLVTVVDAEKPTIIAPAAVNVSNTKGLCGATIEDIGNATASDNCGIATVTNDAPATFPIGTTTVTWTATDIHGNTNMATQLVTVRDIEHPMIKAPGTIRVSNTPGQCGTSLTDLGNPLVSDNCGIASITNDAPSFFPIGFTTVTWKVTDMHGNVTDTAKQLVHVTDNEAPLVYSKPIAVTLVNGTVTIQAADVNNNSSDNCGIASITLSKYKFTCADIGVQQIVLTVTDIHGNSNYATANVTVAGTLPTAGISVVPSDNTFTGGNPRNIYLGYGAPSVTLQTNVSGGNSYVYSWSGNGTLNNTNIANPVFTPTAAGNYSFTVTVTNNNGCVTTASTSICVTDIRVPGSNGKKVYVCHGAQTLSISTSAVDAHLRNHSGDKLGTCEQAACTVPLVSNALNQTQTLSNETGANSDLTVVVLPNPSTSFFTLKIQSKAQGAVQIRITDANGRTVESRHNLSANATVQVGHKLISGQYFAELIQGSQRSVVQLIKIK